MINKLININEPYRVWNGWGGCERTPGMWTLERSGRQEVWALPLLYFLSGCTAALQEGPGGREDGAFGCPRWRPSSPGPLRGCPWFPWLPWRPPASLQSAVLSPACEGQLFGAELAGKQLIVMPCRCSSSLLFASLRRATSPSSHTKMQAESFAMNRP